MDRSPTPPSPRHDDAPTGSTTTGRASSPPHRPPNANSRQRYESLAGLLPRPPGGADDGSHGHMSIADDGGSGNGGRRRRFLRRSFGYDSPCAALLGLAAVVTLGAVLGRIFPPEPSIDAAAERWDAASNVLGYSYFLAWTLSFYPQIVTNWKHPSEAQNGVSLDFVAWNVVGFTCYSVYTTSFRYGEEVRREYAERFGPGEAAPQVKANDVAFAWHALVLTIITFVQIARGGKRGEGDDAAGTRADEGQIGAGGERDDGASSEEEGDFLVSDPECDANDASPRSSGSRGPSADDGGRGERARDTRRRNRGRGPRRWTGLVSPATKLLVPLLLSACVAGAIAVACDANIEWIDYLYFLSFVKVAVSVVKYIPQVVLNHRRKSTSGWQIWNILLDFSGGTLSVVQLVGDSLAEARARGLPYGWTGIVGNPAKLGLGLVSIFFDVIFMFQHYVLYSPPSEGHRRREEHDASLNGDCDTPLLSDR